MPHFIFNASNIRKHNAKSLMRRQARNAASTIFGSGITSQLCNSPRAEKQS